jgi:hypothetical protein
MLLVSFEIPSSIFDGTVFANCPTISALVVQSALADVEVDLRIVAPVAERVVADLASA